MTVELVLLLGIWGTIILGVFIGPYGPTETFKKSAPRLAARVERNIAIGTGFRSSGGGKEVQWHKGK
jgi:hypothetical protein